MASYNYAEKLAAEGNRKLFQNRDTDEDADWSIVSGDGDTFRVHPVIFKSRSGYFLSSN